MFILNKGFCSVKNSKNFIENEISLGKQSSRKLRVWRKSERMSIIALKCKHCYYFPQFLRSDLLCRISTMNLRNDCKQLSFCISYFFGSEFLHPSNNRPCWVKHELLHSLILIRSKVLQNRYDIENLIQNYCIR